LTKSKIVELPRGNSGHADLLRLLIDSVKDYAIFVLDPTGHVLTWNPGAEALKGYTREEIVGQHFSKFYPPDAVQSGWPEHELAMTRKEGRFADEGWRVKKDGSTFWASVVITALQTPEGDLAGFAKVTQDMTVRRQGEQRIQALNRELQLKVSELDESRRVIELRTLDLQKLSSQLLRVQDQERRRLARDLHDGFGQQLIAMKMMIGRASPTEMEAEFDSAIASVRNMSYLLHPPLLDETGLRAALHWFVDGLTKRSNIQISLNVVPTVFPRLSNDMEATIFRVVQEALNNVCKHSGSETARVEISRKADRVLITIRDFGRGIPSALTGTQISRDFGVGIMGMRERLRQLGGELTISRAEPGALVEAKLPL
jgi:PAS domain S-box-containing protein